MELKDQAIIACGCFLVTILSVIGGIFLYKKISDNATRATRIEIAQQKCKEYTDLACSFKPPGDKNSSQIMGGDVVPEGMLPHQVYVVIYLKNGTGPLECGGSLINEKFILTAAHCVLNVQLDQTYVQLGRLIVNAFDTNLEQRKKIKQGHVHPEYETIVGELLKDIGLLELEEKVTFSSNVRPICLSTKSENNYESMIVSGWGQTEEVIRGLNSLKMVELRIDDEAKEFCRRLFGKDYSLVEKTILCLSHRTKGAFAGDSGGPLQVKLESNCSNTWEQIGIVSHGAKNAYQGENPTAQLFIKVEYFVPWIVSVAWPD